VPAHKTELFKKHLQVMLQDFLGEQVSRSDSWDFFKDFIRGIIQFTVEQEDHTLPLSGVGKFQVLKTKPRVGAKAGLKRSKEGNWVNDPDAEPWEFVPKFRFYPSINIDRMLENYFGFANHDIEEVNYGIYADDKKGGGIARKTPSRKSVKEKKGTSKKESSNRVFLGDFEDFSSLTDD